MDPDDPKLSIPTDVDPDQSCSQCGSRDIQLAPLQREVGWNTCCILLIQIFADGGPHVRLVSPYTPSSGFYFICCKGAHHDFSTIHALLCDCSSNRMRWLHNSDTIVRDSNIFAR